MKTRKYSFITFCILSLLVITVVFIVLITDGDPLVRTYKSPISGCMDGQGLILFRDGKMYGFNIAHDIFRFEYEYKKVGNNNLEVILPNKKILKIKLTWYGGYINDEKCLSRCFFAEGPSFETMKNWEKEKKDTL